METEMLKKILDNQVEMLGEIREIKVKVTALEEKVSGLETRMDSLETRMTSLETRMDGMETRMVSFEESQLFIKNTVLNIEQDHGRKLGAAFDGYTANYELIERLDPRISKLERTVEMLTFKVNYLSVPPTASEAAAELKRHMEKQ